MTINWIAKLKNINGIEQIHFSVRDTEKTNKISGSICLDDDETIEGNLVQYLKNKLGAELVSEYENEAENIIDELPTQLPASLPEPETTEE